MLHRVKQPEEPREQLRSPRNPAALSTGHWRRGRAPDGRSPGDGTPGPGVRTLVRTAPRLPESDARRISANRGARPSQVQPPDAKAGAAETHPISSLVAQPRLAGRRGGDTPAGIGRCLAETSPREPICQLSKPSGERGATRVPDGPRHE